MLKQKLLESDSVILTPLFSQADCSFVVPVQFCEANFSCRNCLSRKEKVKCTMTSFYVKLWHWFKK